MFNVALVTALAAELLVYLPIKWEPNFKPTLRLDSFYDHMDSVVDPALSNGFQKNIWELSVLLSVTSLVLCCYIHIVLTRYL